MAEKDRRLQQARSHLEFVCYLYRLQHQRVRTFVHEHPPPATSWREGSIRQLEEYSNAVKLTIDQCPARAASSSEAEVDVHM